jgi:hypothetical protein
MPIPLLGRLLLSSAIRGSLRDKETPDLSNARIRLKSRVIFSPRVGKKIQNARDKKISQIMGFALNEVKPLTPIDTGKARRNWKIEGKSVNTIVVNRVPYIRRLEDGHSNQAPNGFVKTLIKKIRRKFRK